MLKLKDQLNLARKEKKNHGQIFTLQSHLNKNKNPTNVVNVQKGSIFFKMFFGQNPFTCIQYNFIALEHTTQPIQPKIADRLEQLQYVAPRLKKADDITLF